MIYFNVVKTEQLETEIETETPGHKTETETQGLKTETETETGDYKTETETETQGLKTETEPLKFESQDVSRPRLESRVLHLCCLGWLQTRHTTENNIAVVK